jgi:hypothetical protein
MSSFDFNQFLDHLKEELGAVAAEFGSELKDDLINDGVQFVQKPAMTCKPGLNSC